MAKNKATVFQRIQQVLTGNSNEQNLSVNNTYNINSNNDIIGTATNKEDYQMKLLQAKQQKLLGRQWVKAQYDITNHSLSGLNDLKLSYRDSDLMNGWPEISAALDIFAEESTTTNDNGFIVNITSKSDRIKSILQDLFVNKLSINIMLPMICRSMCLYGNSFMLLNIDQNRGVIGWKQMPVYEIERYENGMNCPYATNVGYNLNNVNEKNVDKTKFIWVGQSEYIPYREFQIAHFRLLYDSQFLPYGVSILNKARRHFRMLSMMEDSMLIYRLDRSIERRVFKINVGAIDEADVQSYVQTIANNFKRTSIIDPMTGQVDLRKNIMPVWKKTPIPLLDGRTMTIEDLSKECENGKTNFVYSIQEDTKQIVPGKVVWCGKNYTAKSMVKITLDDDSYMAMAPEHEVIMRDGSRKRADKLCVGESVMPFYRKFEPLEKRFKADYEQIYNPNSGIYEFTHRLIAKELKKEKRETVIHHLNLNRFDNNSLNLKWMKWKGNKKLHADVFDEHICNELREKVLDHTLNYCNEIIQYLNDYLLEYINSINTTSINKVSNGILLRQIRKKGFEGAKDYLNNIKRNHKIKKIELIDGDDVYCMTVEGLNGEQDRHNFALRTFKENGKWNESGCFVSNCQMDDFFIPVREDNASSPIETLPAGQNLTAMDDIKYIQNKILAALRIPKTFLNFEDSAGDGKNLSLLDVRFTRTVNRIQQALLMELNKVAIIHLCLLGFFDELNNFSLTMNNPSSQAEMLALENLSKKITTAKDAVSDPGGGIPLTSMTWAWKNIMKWSDKEIQRNLEEIRLETALAAELQKTMQIIKKTGLFDSVDNIYGEPGAEYQEDSGEQGPQPNGAPVGGGGMPINAGDMDFGTEGEDMDVGQEGEMPMDAAAMEDGASGAPTQNNGGENIPNLGEMILRGMKNKITEDKEMLNKKLVEKSKKYSQNLINKLVEIASTHPNAKEESDVNDLYLKNLSLNEELAKISDELKKIGDSNNSLA